MQVKITSSSRLQRGITLLESLIAILAMALGVLGVLGAQMRTIVDVQTSVRRGQAVRLIEDLSERIQLNPNALGNMSAYLTTWTVVPTLPAAGAAMAPVAQAAYDLALWKQTVVNTLPLGDAQIFYADGETDAAVAPNRRQLGVMISWRENERELKTDTAVTKAAYKVVFKPDSTGKADTTCPADRICHLQYIQPNARCLPNFNSGAAAPALFCPQ